MRTTKNNKTNANTTTTANNIRNNKSSRRTRVKKQDRHADLVDSFQWGFVEGAENESNEEHKEFHPQGKPRKKAKMKTAAKNIIDSASVPVVASTRSVSSIGVEKITTPKSSKNTKGVIKKKKKKNRQIAITPEINVTNIADNSNVIAGKSPTNSIPETTKISAGKTQSGKNSAARGNAKSSRQKITAASPVAVQSSSGDNDTVNLLFEPFDDDNDLKLPSYGRSYKKTPTLEPETKFADTTNTVTEKRQPYNSFDSSSSPVLKSTVSSSAKIPESAGQVIEPDSNFRNVKSSQSNWSSDKLNHGKFDYRPPTPPELTKPKKEQMVWDPDKREYVPLKISDQTLSPDSLSATSNNLSENLSSVKSSPVSRQVSAVLNQQTTSAESLSSKVAVKSELKRGNQLSVVNLSNTDNLLQSNLQQRGDVPRPVASKRPDPADIEADARGFASLGLSDVMLEALRILRYLEPTPIQAGVFERVKTGKDIMGQAQTGTGKTAAFSIPIIEGIEECPPGDEPVAMILVPTRELAVQVRDEIVRLSYGRDIRIAACYGGKPIVKQIEKLSGGIDIVVGTPGRVLDLINRRVLLMDSLKWVVLDEADRMLDIGFRPDIEKILKKSPATRQTLLFSATLPPPVVKLAERYMREPETLDFSNKHVSVDTIEQFYVTVDHERKFDALVYLLNEERPNQAIIFTRTKRGADRLARLLSKQIASLAAIHGDLPQSERDKIMSKFRAGELRYLVATDVVGRGIDVSGISHIINYDIPHFCDDYVHRVGRTGRMGREGVAYTFVTAEEGNELTRIEMRIEKLLKRADLKGFESFSKPVQTAGGVGGNDNNSSSNPKPVFGKPVRKIRRAL
ncbi:MAG: DEAD/DEAH box helicase [Planctomycetaceae bacterium]|jgi:ATP-dependent RNA helicase DeaD|nr:DEAD/DEAH box helicase [Planctomycetaceae bacterium]